VTNSTPTGSSPFFLGQSLVRLTKFRPFEPALGKLA
jgi:hypothetical protein